MMTATDFMQFQSEAFKATNAFAAKSIEGMQQIADLNMKITKTSLESSAEQVKTLMAAKDAKALTEMLADNAKPNEQLTAYAKEVFDITTKSNAELAELIQDQVEQGNQQFLEAVDAMEKNAPAGSEGAFSFLKQYVAASRSAYEQATKAGKQFSDMTQANVATTATKGKKKA